MPVDCEPGARAHGKGEPRPGKPPRVPLRRILIPPVPLGRFFRDLWREIQEDNLSNGAAALAYFLILAIFPAMIFFLSLLPYLPIPHLEQAIVDLLREALPAQAAELLMGTVTGIVSERRGDLLSFSVVATLWAASNGIDAVMQQLNITYDVKDARPFWKRRGLALLLLVMFSALVVAAFGLIVSGGMLQAWLGEHLGVSPALLAVFAIFRWIVIFGLFLLGFAVIYYFGPDVEQSFRFVTAGGVVGTVVLALATLAFRVYVDNFGSYEAMYGSLGAAIILLLWLYVAGNVLLLGAEVNALLEHYTPEGKRKGEKALG